MNFLQIPDDQLKVISECLLAGPYGRVKPVIDNLNMQLELAQRKREQELQAELDAAKPKAARTAKGPAKKASAKPRSRGPAMVAKPPVE